MKPLRHIFLRKASSECLKWPIKTFSMYIKNNSSCLKQKLLRFCFPSPAQVSRPPPVHQGERGPPDRRLPRPPPPGVDRPAQGPGRWPGRGARALPLRRAGGPPAQRTVRAQRLPGRKEIRVASQPPSERKNAPSSVKKIPKWAFYYIRGSEKMPDTQKDGSFFEFYCIFIDKEKNPMSQKEPNFPKKALKIPGWQHWKKFKIKYCFCVHLFFYIFLSSSFAAGATSASPTRRSSRSTLGGATGWGS